MIKNLALVFSVLLLNVCHSQTIEEGWSCFDGSIGKSNIVVNIYCDSNGNLTGDYCYKKFENRIVLKGKLKDKLLFLDEIVEGKINAKFNGKTDDDKETIAGKWSSTTHSDLSFFLKLNSWNGNSLKNRYSMGKTNEEVESFFKKIKEAFEKDDKVWLSKNIAFPITLRDGKKKLKIKNAKNLLENYSLVITQPLKKSITESCICNIFSNGQGAMIANGAIWVNEFANHLKITAINN